MATNEQQYTESVHTSEMESVDVTDKFPQIYNAQYYGVVSENNREEDDETDNGEKLTALVAQLSAAGGGTIYLPAGIYMVDSPIIWSSNVSLIGDGVGRTVIMPRKTDADAENFPAIGYAEDAGWSADNPMVNCNFRDFTIDGIEVNVGTYNPLPKGIFILYMKDCSFENLMIQNTGATGLGVDFLQNVTISKVHCYNCGRAYEVTEEEAVKGGAGIGIATMGMPVESCIITDCITENCGNYGIFVEGTGPSKLYVDADGNMATNGHFTIANCQCYGGRNYGIVVKTTHNVVVANNICNGNATDGIALLGRSGYGYFDLYSDGVSITGNRSVGNGRNGIRLADFSNMSKNILVADNICRDNAADGFVLDNTFDGLTITGNTFSDNIANGIHFAPSDSPSSKILIADNICNGNRQYGLYLHTSVDGLNVIANAFASNGRDGLLIPYPISNSRFVANTITDNTARGVAIADHTFTNVDFIGNIIRDNSEQDWVVKGTFSGTKVGGQAVQILYPMDFDWSNGYLDNNGALINSEGSFVTDAYFYCGGAIYVGFELGAAQVGTSNRIIQASFYDSAKGHLSRRYNTSAADAGVYRFEVPAGACYVRFRMGYTTEIASKAAVLSEGRLQIYATDRT